MITVILIYGALCFGLLTWIRWRRKRLLFFKELGIPGPEPQFLFGNIIELNKKGPFKCQEEWIKKYGEVLGFYHGLKPVLLVADPDLLRKIFIKDFHLFSDRPESIPLRMHSFLDYIIPASEIMDSVLTNLKGKRWKSVRSILSPTFAAKKLKLMIPTVNQLVDSLNDMLEVKCHNSEVIDIHKYMQRLTLDLICAQAFAMDIDCLNNWKHPFLESAINISELPHSSKIVFFGNCFPEFGILAMTINFLKMFIRNKGRIAPLEITNALEKVIKLRREHPDMQKPDLLQLLMNASLTIDEETDSFSDASKPPKKLTLTDLEIKSNALVVFLAGFETTSTTLGFAFHFLAKYPELQEKIQKEIDDVIEKEGELDYYNINHFQLMERFLFETLRFYPAASFFVARISNCDVNYGSLKIPKGLQINVPVKYIHESAKFWNKPQDFDPDRFCSENKTNNHTVNYWAFGAGPRSCVGTRLVHLTFKVILAKILHKFTIYPVDSFTKIEIPIKFKYWTIEPESVPVKFKLRTSK